MQVLDATLRPRAIFPMLLVASLLSVPSGGTAEQYYDLGGPCKDGTGPNYREIAEAKKGDSPDHLIDLERQQVRGGCSNQYRWYGLAATLLTAHRETAALQVLQEMDSRGFDLNPSFLPDSHPEVGAFMETPAFKLSPVGRKVENLKQISNERRARFRAALKALPASQKPPEHYIAKGACPFECCTYRSWTVLNDTDLVTAPGSKQIVGRAKKGSHALGLTGEVHLKPEPVVVLFGGNLPENSIVFILDHGGEGSGHVYSRGRIVSADLSYADYCFHLSEGCWGETLSLPNERTKPVWWVKVKLPNGITGWTDQNDNFGNKDSCG